MLIAVLSVVLFSGPIRDIDFWWHINSGRWILAHRGLPVGDPLSMYPTINHWARTILQGQWAGQVWLFWVFDTFGSLGVVVSRVVVLGATLGFMAWRLARTGVPPVVQAVGIIATGVVLSGYTADRPQLFSLLLFAVLMVVLDLAETRRQWRWAALLILVIWTNLHQGALLGAVIAAGHFSILALRDFRSGDKRSGRQDVLVAILALLCPFATPNGFNGVGYLIWMEFQPARQRASEYASPFAYGSMTWNMPHLAAFFVFMAAMLLVLAKSVRRFPLQSVLPALLLFLGATAYRYVPFALLGGLPFLFSRLPRSSQWQRMLTAGLAIVTGAILLRAVAISLPQITDWGVSEAHMPVALVKEARRLGASGNVFTTVGWGGYLSWQFGDDARPYIDGRHLMNTERLEIYTHMLWLTPRGQREFERARFDWVLMPHRNLLAPKDPPYPLVNYLRHHPEWRLRFVSDQGVLFSR